ncbi:centrin [Gregarina niphandrodes]|uniref:Centrin n=1 Tax=Gregarina niphandrodes TaxID=110365 RepID=A0A023B0E9_GRENI|nr:centrin [Gregarina niphandrodes]EZG44168.1 centrin [Gregarina niphandrodes]|eukprot:XP_011132779.1 centrin [Gregarina niphandrodes]
MKALGFEITKQHIMDVMKQFDPQNTGYISFNDFITLMTDRITSRDPMEEIALAFKLFDDDDSGLITLDKLKRVAMQLGEDLTDEELKSMIEEFDKDMDGCIDQKEFAAIMTQAALF